MNEQYTYYQLGQRDALAEILTIARAKQDITLVGLMKELATSLLQSDPDHCHAKWWINQEETSMIPRLFIDNDWYAFQTKPDTIELFHYNVMVDNGSIEHYAHYCTITWKDDCMDLNAVDSEVVPWNMLIDIFEGRAA